MLDCLRTVAILLVLGRHVPAEHRENAFLAYWHCGGWAGVDLFFVLSGFLVSSLLFREFQERGSINAWRFYTRRGLKIYPAFYVFLAVSLGYLWMTTGSVWVWTIVVEGGFLQNYLPRYALWDHTWSLAVEEHFYLTLPVAMLALGGRFKLVPGVFVALAILCCGLRLFSSLGGYGHVHFYTHFRIDSLFCGVCVAYLYSFHSVAFTALVTKWRSALLAIGTLAFVPAFAYDGNRWWISVYYVILLYLGSACLVCWAIPVRTPGLLGQLVAVIGSYSYSIYLWHVVALEWVAAPLAGANTSLFWALYLAVTFGLGVAMAHLVEYPVLRVRDWLFPSPNSSVAGAL